MTVEAREPRESRDEPIVEEVFFPGLTPEALLATNPNDERPPDGVVVRATFRLGGSVPRRERARERYRANQVYVRLESTIYGPITRAELASLLASGHFTGYEAASTDMQHWTPLLYHPKMNLTGDADPDETHALLHEHTALPQVSTKPRRKVRLEDLADDDEQLNDLEPATPLAAIMIKPRKQQIVEKRSDLERESLEEGQRTLDLPVFGSLEEEDEEAIRRRFEEQEEARASEWEDLVPEDEPEHGWEPDANNELTELLHSGGYPTAPSDDQAYVETEPLDADAISDALGEPTDDADVPASAEAVPPEKKSSAPIVAGLFVAILITFALIYCFVLKP